MIGVFTFLLWIFAINCSTENNPTSTDTTDEQHLLNLIYMITELLSL